MREGKAEIGVYDVSLSLKRRILMAGLTNLHDVASCANNNCLFICDWIGNRVYRVEKATNWQVKVETH